MIAGCRDLGCLVSDDARIDQLRAIRKAASAGHRRMAVTVNAFYGESYRAVRELERELELRITLAAVCSTGIGRERAREIADFADIGWSCASSHVRSLGSRALVQLTYGIPVFVYTSRGLELIAAYSDPSGRPILKGLDTGGQYILASDVEGKEISVGRGRLYLAPAKLPVIKGKQPDPLH
jgi:hypothetical protein